MRVEFLVEEPSAEAALNNLLPKMLPSEIEFVIHSFQSKQGLLSNLPNRLRGYRRWLPPDWRIAVLVDEDRQDCHALKAQLERAAREARLRTKSMAAGGERFQLLNRVAVEELEAWFFGDVNAIVAAYPGVPVTLGNREGFRDPDAIAGGTWEALERILKRAGYYSTGLPKIETARNISQYMDPPRNRSKSFQVFRAGLQALIGG
jgi:hypothetical protein